MSNGERTSGIASSGYVFPAEFDVDVQQEMNQLSAQINQQRLSVIDALVRTGGLLKQAKAIVQGRKLDRFFRSWVESNFDFTVMTAYRYISIYEAFGDKTLTANFSQRALIELSKPDVTESVRNKAIKMAQGNTFVNETVARNVIGTGASKKVSHSVLRDSTRSNGEETQSESAVGDKEPTETAQSPTDEHIDEAPLIVTDSTGRKVPDELASTFIMAAEFDEARQKTRALKSWGEKITATPPGQVLERSMLQFRRDLKNLDNALIFAKPYAVCSYCNASLPGIANCSACHGTGWLVKSVYDQSPVAREAARRAAAETFSPDGKTLASGSWDKSTKLWDVAGGKNTATLKGYTGLVFSVAFSPDGKTLASGSYDKSIKLWDVASRKNTATLKGHTEDVWSVAFSPGGKTVASASSDKSIKLWDVARGKKD